MSSYFQPLPINTFRCPLCGSTAYDYVFVRRQDGSILQTQAYQCGGCSVMFRDPKKFTEQEQRTGGDARAAATAHALMIVPPSRA